MIKTSFGCIETARSEFSDACYQGGQSHGQHDWVHRFPEPVKSFITFVLLSQKCKKTSYFSAQDCVKVSPDFAVVSEIT